MTRDDDAFSVPARSRLRAVALTTTMVVGFAGVTVVTPLLPQYRSEWDLSVATAALVFVMYVVGVVASLLVLGRLADVIGDRVVILAAMAVCGLATLLALVAPSVGWLLVARVLEGIAVGMLPGPTAAAVTAAVGAGTAARLVSLATTGGIAAGLLLGAATAHAGPRPAWTCYLALTGAVTVWVAVATTGTQRPTTAARLVLQRPVLPRRRRVEFVVALGGAAVAFAALGLFAGLGPALIGERSRSVALGAVVAASAYLVSGAAQQLRPRRSSSLRSGAAVLVLGLVAVALATHVRSLALFAVAAVLVGVGNGWVFAPTVATANSLAPPGQRAGAISTYYLAMYAGVALPLLGLGALADLTSLTTAVQVFAVVVGLSALALAMQGRDPPAAAAPPATSPSPPSERFNRCQTR